MRVFLAIEFPGNIKEYLTEVQEGVKKQSLGGNFTRKNNFHLTLKFIGEVKSEEVDRLKEAMNQAAQNQQPFTFTLQKLGQFPRGSKKIIWVGLEENEMLQRLYSHLEIALEEQGYPKEGKKYTPHITIGREVVLTEQFPQLLQKINIQNVSIPVDKISLMESTRIKGELTYIPFYSKEFNGND